MRQATQQIETNAPTVTFMAGGPGAGKGYIRRTMFSDLPTVDSDDWKKIHPDYDPKNPAPVHAWSSDMADEEFDYRLAIFENFIMDGTCTSVESTLEKIEKVRAAGFRVKMVYVKTSLTVAKERNQKRARTVPEHIVTEKHATIEASMAELQHYVDEFVTVRND